VSSTLPLLAALLHMYAAGDIADCETALVEQSAAARTAELIPQGSTVLMLGDAVYHRATRARLADCYAPTWGVHLANTLAVPGNHDYVAGGTGDFLAYFGPAAGAHGYFARRFDGWLVIGLDSTQPPGGLDRQYAWLEATLATHRDARCTLAMWHEPVFSSGLHRGSGEHMRRFWALLDTHGADVALHGHEHFYEGFDPLDADGHPSRAGIRSFVVGTGGANLRGFRSPPYASRARAQRHGVLHLTLRDDGYDWEFIDVDGGVHDTGTANCRQASRQDDAGEEHGRQ